MSAFEVEDSHIRYLLRALHKYDRETRARSIDEWKSDAIMLRNANHQSVYYRYEDTEPYIAEDFDLSWADLLDVPCTPIQTIKAVHCFEYQACEPPTWKGSPAYDWCERLQRLATYAMPGYEEADWAIPYAPARPNTIRRLV